MNTKINYKKKLPREFYSGNAVNIAQKLLGKIFVKTEDEIILAGRIVETEAYKGNVDESAHSFRGITNRNKVMFEQGGLLYVYFTYGVHFCSNIVTGKKGEGDAVLLRGIEPLSGIDIMAKRRFGKNHTDEKELLNLTNGPGKICQAFGLNREHNGSDLTSTDIFLLDQPDISKQQIVTTTRIGIKKSVDLPWRFYIKNNLYVSRK